MKLNVLLLLLLFVVEAYSQETIVVYNRNLSNDFVSESIKNAASLSIPKFGEYQLVASKDMEVGEAFEALVKGDIDLFVGAPTIEREQSAAIIHIPLDRGLLGFRLCLVNKDAEKFKSIRSVSQFVEQELTVGLGEFWPDRNIFNVNGFKTVSSPIFRNLFDMLDKRKFDCLTRSVNEITSDLATYKDLNIEIDQELVMIYPNADFIFINPNKPELVKRFTQGLNQALNNYSYYDIFDKHFKEVLEQHKVYDRKLIFLNEQEMSPNTINAINRYGIASFIIN